MVDYVFLGPSLPLAEARSLLPDAVFRPPIQHGDLFKINPAPGDRVLIIDGLFMQTPSVRHREILDLLSRGVYVAGSSSMGALRAAELWRYGMRGVGRVFELYRAGVVTGDDEVAVVHAPAEDGYVSLSEPLVNLRIHLSDAVFAGRLTQTEADRLLEIGRSLPFRARGPRALELQARKALTGDSIDRYLAWDRECPRDAKADDARLLLSMAARNAVELAEPDHPLAPIENIETHDFERWRGRHGGERVGDRWVPDTSTVTAIMALHPEYPTLHRRRILATLSEAPAGAPDTVLIRGALNFARVNGFFVDAQPGEPAVSPWLMSAERHLGPEEATLRVLVRAFGTGACSSLSARALSPALQDPAIVAATRSFLRSALRLADQLPRPDPRRPHLRLGFGAEAINRIFAKLWGRSPDELPGAAWDRGFRDLVQLHTYTGPYVAALRVAGPPRFPATVSGNS
ncbi:MAG TPA: TfuA-like protein [Micromonosporaceae bacterium]|nr:TfuA-like protein [Micromonosporaceae bacterium]